MTAPAGQVVTCANCGREFNGRFCPDCGQDQEDIRRPFAEISRDFLGDFFAFDARIFRTLAPLLTRPGDLTVHYIEGRRARYVPPLKLYVFAAFLYFTIVAIGGGGPFRPFATEGEEGVVIGFGAPRDRSPAADGSNRPPASRHPALSDSSRGGAMREVEARARKAARDEEAYGRAVQGTLSYAHFLLLPVLGLLLEAFYRHRYYAEHLVFGMHFHALALLTAAPIVAAIDFIPALDRQGSAARAIVSVWYLGLGAYLLLAMRRVYGGGFLGTLWRWAALGLLYAILAGLILGLVAFLTLWLY